MGAFDNMYNHFEKNMGNIGASRGIFREPNPEDLQHLYNQPTVEELLHAIRASKKEQSTQKSLDLSKAGPGRPKKEGGRKAFPNRGDYPTADKTYAAAY